MTQVGDILQATTEGEYRQRLAELPFRVVVSVTRGAGGRTVLQKDYLIHGTRKLSLFHTPGSSPAAAPPLGGGTHVPRATQWETAASTEIPTDFCETEFGGVVYYDACATEQDFSDAAAMLASLEYGVESYQTQMASATSSYCATAIDPELCSSVYMSSMVDLSFAGLSSLPKSAFDCIGEAGTDIAEFGSGCAQSAMEAVGALFGWLLALDSAHGLMMTGVRTGIRVTARRALLVGVGGATVSAYAVGFGVGNYLRCLAT